MPNFNFDKPASETVSSLEVRSMRVSVPLKEDILIFWM